jgi:hypothetical protein
MENESIGKKLKLFWHWLWNSESIWSYLVFLILVFIVIKFIFFPFLSLVMSTKLPLAIVESDSMNHNSINAPYGYDLCGHTLLFGKFFNKEEYWQACGNWYENKTNISKEDFSNFKFSNGFAKGDLIIIYGKKDIHVGDVIVFDGGRNHPIIHRVVSLEPLQTKGDHNSDQLPAEKIIYQDQVLGTAVGKIPYIGWIKLGMVNILNFIFK